MDLHGRLFRSLTRFTPLPKTLRLADRLFLDHVVAALHLRIAHLPEHLKLFCAQKFILDRLLNENRKGFLNDGGDEDGEDNLFSILDLSLLVINAEEDEKEEEEESLEISCDVKEEGDGGQEESFQDHDDDLDEVTSQSVVYKEEEEDIESKVMPAKEVKRHLGPSQVGDPRMRTLRKAKPSSGVANSEGRGGGTISGKKKKSPSKVLRSCLHCDYTTTGRTNLWRHIRSQHMDREDRTLHPCGICGKEFVYRWYVAEHVKAVHQGIKDLSCDHCEMKFSARNTLRSHVRTVHFGVKDQRCPHCDFTSVYKDNVKTHVIALHDAERRELFRCDSCEKEFVHHWYLAVHNKAVHEKVKDLACDLCEAKFSSKMNLRAHVNGVHNKFRFSCDDCSKDFASKGYLEIHSRKVHSGREIKMEQVSVNPSGSNLRRNVDKVRNRGKDSARDVKVKFSWRKNKGVH